MLTWAVAFIWTCALELPVYHVFVGPYFARLACFLLLVLGINGLTHPLLNLVAPTLVSFSYWEVAGEVVVTLTEGAIVGVVLRRFSECATPYRSGLIAAFWANLLTALASFPFQWIFQ